MEYIHMLVRLGQEGRRSTLKRKELKHLKELGGEELRTADFRDCQSYGRF